MVKAYSMALTDFPRINSLYFPEKPDECEVHSSHNISIAIDSPSGLVAPNIKNAQDLSIREIQEEILRLRDLAIEKRIGTEELFGGTVGMSNIGTIGGTYGAPINLRNQVCIVAIGSTKDKPTFVEPVQVDGRTLYDVTMSKIVSLTPNHPLISY